MKLHLLCVGRLSESYLREGVVDFSSRVQRYLPLTVTELREEKGGKKADPGFFREREGERLLARITNEAFVVALDEKGKTLQSEQLSEFLGQHMVQGTGELAFVIGGAYGLSEAVRKRANLVLSLSPLTFTHQMARLILFEQLYRSMTILRNEPYHNR
ncbi:23S rRNA (pseudouridine(1915)-N(3))-methyltransferase RlmH [Desulfuromonas sp. AOP6]|uniref:23S rRNA (pseudouridine(1915)-N(3))-methyltransferase RlmH n=1 Tax=Desulfuromonas sp. AOP6 TaxID=1566351 RepID=UPI00127BCAE0|nr:23S rRNA (pseudouridine(1915)-N(3))-methyltransferase RlmH [Desulfuromonas sp. AOP6]BCA80986.1 ribosomal RNA large subunit methyltransferase H [Desulfuromonas sp. AOP6]